MDNKYTFTDREIDILKLLSVGLSNTKIAQLLYISPHTVKAHVASMYRKAQVNGRLLLVVQAYKNGILHD